MNDSTDLATPKTATHPSGLLTDLERSVAMLELTAPQDALLELRDRLSFLRNSLKTLSDSLEEKFIEWINVNGEITYGTKRLYVGSKKDNKCVDQRAALEALMQVCGGDWEQFCGCLASGAIKPGAAKQVMGEETWSKHFQVVEKTELKDGVAKPVKGLIEVDTKFVKPKGK